MTSLTDWLDEIEQRAEAATPGRWEYSEQSFGRGNIISKCKGLPDAWVAQAHPQPTTPERESNARFIAASRTDIPLLCARLRAALRVIREQEYAVELLAGAKSGFISGSEPDMEFENQRDDIVADARGALSAFRTACAEEK